MPSLSVEQFLQVDSAALVRLREGQILLVPEGFWHFVVTILPSLAFSSNALTLAGIKVSEECVGTRQGQRAVYRSRVLAEQRAGVRRVVWRW